MDRPIEAGPEADWLRMAAYHEAGHATAAFELGRAVDLVSVEDKGEYGVGRTVFRGAPRRPRSKVERELIVAAAGCAEWVRATVSGPEGMATDPRLIAARAFAHLLDQGTAPEPNDLSNARQLAAKLGGDVDGRIGTALVRAAVMMNTPSTWRAVEALARELMTRGVLVGAEARAIYLAAVDVRHARSFITDADCAGGGP